MSKISLQSDSVSVCLGSELFWLKLWRFLNQISTGRFLSKTAVLWEGGYNLGGRRIQFNDGRVKLSDQDGGCTVEGRWGNSVISIGGRGGARRSTWLAPLVGALSWHGIFSNLISACRRLVRFVCLLVFESNPNITNCYKRREDHTCKKRVMLRWRLFWQKKICGKSA